MISCHCFETKFEQRLLLLLLPTQKVRPSWELESFGTENMNQDTRIRVFLDSWPILAAALQSRSAKCAGSFVTETAPTWHRPTVRVGLGDVVLGMITLRSTWHNLRSTWHNVANKCWELRQSSNMQHCAECSGMMCDASCFQVKDNQTSKLQLHLFSQRQLCSDWFLGGRLSLRSKSFTSHHDLGPLLPFACSAK